MINKNFIYIFFIIITLKPGIEAIPKLTVIKPIFKHVFSNLLGYFPFKHIGNALLFIISKNIGKILIKWPKYKKYTTNGAQFFGFYIENTYVIIDTVILS